MPCQRQKCETRFREGKGVTGNILTTPTLERRKTRSSCPWAVENPQRTSVDANEAETKRKWKLVLGAPRNSEPQQFIFIFKNEMRKKGCQRCRIIENNLLPTSPGGVVDTSAFV